MRFATHSAKRAAMPSRSARSRSGAMSGRWPCGGWDKGVNEMQRRYITVDVFTDRAFGGNPLAVVLDAGGLSTEQMQAVGTAFVLATLAATPPARLLFEEGAGLVPVEIVTEQGKVASTEFTAPQPLRRMSH